MTLTASGPTYRDGVEGGFTLELNTADDVRHLVELLSEDDVFTTMVEGEQGVLDVHVQGSFGYLLYNGPELMSGYSVGDPTSPAVTASETGFPAGSGVRLDVFTDALVEFLDTGRLPTLVHWTRHSHAPSSAEPV